VHALRHTSASLLIDAGAHPKSIQRHLGHSSITTTLNIYGHLMPDEQDQVADALDDLRAGGSRPQRGPDAHEEPEDEEGAGA
jgi:integrase